METQIIGVHTGSPNLVGLLDSFPSGNWIGSMYLHKLLSQALYREGLMSEGEIGSQGELNDGVFLAAVNDVVKAVEVIKREVAPMPCQIAVFESSGPRCIYPSSEIRMGWLLDTERQELASAQIRAKHKLLIDALAQVKDGGGKQE